MSKSTPEELRTESIEQLSRLTGTDSRRLTEILQFILENKSPDVEVLFKKYRKLFAEVKECSYLPHFVMRIMLREHTLLDVDRVIKAKDINTILDREIERLK